MTDLQDIDVAITSSERPDLGRKIANYPIIRQIYGPLNRAAVAGKVELRALIGRAILRSQGQQKTQVAMASLRRLGSFEDVFGRVDEETGLIAADKVKTWGGRDVRLSGRTPGEFNPLAGEAPNDIRTWPDRYKGRLTKQQEAWIEAAHRIEIEKRAFLADHGIHIDDLVFEEGGVYAGRRVYARFDRNGNLLASSSFSSASGPGRPGSKLVSQHPRTDLTHQ